MMSSIWFVSLAQIQTRFFPDKDAMKCIPFEYNENLKNRTVVELPSFDLEKLKKEDVEMDRLYPLLGI